MPQILPYLLCSALYAAVAALLVRALTRPQGKSDNRVRILHTATAVPLLLHTALLYRSMFAGEAMYLGVGDFISAIIWLTVLIYWLFGLFYRIEGLQVFILGAAAILVWASVALPAVRPLTHTDLPAFRLHLLISLLAYSLFTIASLQALIMALLERRLHGGRLPLFLQSLPPLLTMERLLFRIVAFGFVLLTLSLGSGMFFSEELFGQPLKVTHKVVFGIVAWCIFAALLAGRYIYGWRGRLALRWTLAGFLALVLAYIGSKFVLEVILQR
jgi:ABC-type uncharacterized transport system permease subunit